MPRAVERCLELPLLLGFCQVLSNGLKTLMTERMFHILARATFFRSLSTMSTGHTLTEVQ